MLAKHKLKLIEVDGSDCHPYANHGDSLLVATDIAPNEGDWIVFTGKDEHCHVGTYHLHNSDTPVVLPGHGIKPVFIDAVTVMIGPVIQKIQWIKSLPPMD